MIILVEVKAIYIEEVEGVVITDLRKITKPVIHEDNRVTHEESVNLPLV